MTEKMFKVIIADDEPLIIKGLREIICWRDLKCEIVAEAGDGRELMEAIGQFDPDIVISDVAMPHMSGLDVIKAAKDIGKNVKIIYLSGYQKFDYVKQAIQYEAVEYLIKPVSKEELIRAVEKAERMLRRENPVKYWEEKNDVRDVLRSSAKEKEEKLFQYFQEMGMDIHGKKFTGVCFSVPASFHSIIGDIDKAELLKFSIFKKIESDMKNRKSGFAVNREENNSNIIFIGNGGTESRDVEAEVQLIREEIHKEYHVWLVTGIGETVDSVSKLQYASKTARFCAELYFFTQEYVTCYWKINKNYTFSFDDYNNKFGEVVTEILKKNPEWTKKVDEVLEIIKELHYGNRYALEHRCISMMLDLFKELAEYELIQPKLRKEFERIIVQLRNKGDFEELKSYIKGTVLNFISTYMDMEKIEDKYVIKKVKTYIREHYREELTLEKMAKMVYLNPYYFSTFFKKETGKNFKEYLTEIRMKEAVRLLGNSDIKTYELAEATGYHDVGNFTEKFKEFYGETPAKYKKKMRTNL